MTTIYHLPSFRRFASANERAAIAPVSQKHGTSHICPFRNDVCFYRWVRCTAGMRTEARISSGMMVDGRFRRMMDARVVDCHFRRIWRIVRYLVSHQRGTLRSCYFRNGVCFYRWIRRIAGMRAHRSPIAGCSYRRPAMCHMDCIAGLAIAGFSYRQFGLLSVSCIAGLAYRRVRLGSPIAGIPIAGTPHRRAVYRRALLNVLSPGFKIRR